MSPILSVKVQSCLHLSAAFVLVASEQHENRLEVSPISRSIAAVVFSVKVLSSLDDEGGWGERGRGVYVEKRSAQIKQPESIPQALQLQLRSTQQISWALEKPRGFRLEAK